MKKFCDAYRKSAIRVKGLLSQEKKIEVLAAFRREENWQKRDCVALKMPRRPAILEQLFFLGYQVAYEMRKKTSGALQATKEIASQCCKSLRHPTSFYSTEHQAGPLSSRRLRHVTLKEYLLAARKLQEMATRSGQRVALPALITAFDDPLPQKKEEDSSSMEMWQEYIKNNEERHFQIGRVIKYLSE